MTPGFAGIEKSLHFEARNERAVAACIERTRIVVVDYLHLNVCLVVTLRALLQKLIANAERGSFVYNCHTVDVNRHFTVGIPHFSLSWAIALHLYEVPGSVLIGT